MADADVNKTLLPPRARALVPHLVLLALNVSFRLPALLNASGVHSDAAIVGLQAMHLLRGETSRFLWGAGYQSSFDAFVVAALFKLFSPSPLMLMLAPLLGHLLLCSLAYLAIARFLSAGRALLVCLPLVFTPQAINAVALYAPRQWCLTSMFFAIVLVGATRKTRWQPVWFFFGAVCSVVAVYLDLYGLQLLPSVWLLMVLATFDAPRSLASSLLRLGGGAAGVGVGAVLVSVLRAGPQAANDKTTLTLDRLSVNWPIFKDTCLPWILGARVWIPGKSLYPELWQPPTAVKVLQYGGAGSLVVLCLLGLLLVFSKRLDWQVKRFGLFGLSAIAATMGGFLVSTNPTDMWSARYLAPVIWAAPFALMPVAAVLQTRGLAVLLAPYLAVAAMGGWLSFGPFVEGPLPRLDPRGQAHDEAEVASVLRERGVEAAMAQYWLSYRLSFLWQEHPVVVPLLGFEDRYAPYRARFDQAHTVAWVFHPSEPRATVDQVQPWLQTQPGKLERLEVAGFTVLIFERSQR